MGSALGGAATVYDVFASHCYRVRLCHLLKSHPSYTMEDNGQSKP